MTSGEIGDIFYEMFVMAITFGGPILLGAMVVGVLISILQAATQIQEQTLSFVPKLLVIAVLLVVMGSTILSGLQDFFKSILFYIAEG